jgi:hypothetical protein
MFDDDTHSTTAQAEETRSFDALIIGAGLRVADHKGLRLWI